MSHEDRMKKVLEELDTLQAKQQTRAENEKKIQQLENEDYKHDSFTPRKAADCDNLIASLDTKGADYKVFRLGLIRHVLSKEPEIGQQFIGS